MLLIFGVSGQFGDFGLSINVFRKDVSIEIAQNTRIFLGIIQTLFAIIIGLIGRIIVKDISMYALGVIALTSFIGVLAFGKEVTLRNGLRYRTLSIISVGQQLVVVGSELSLLICHFGYMSLIFGALFGQIFRVILILGVNPRSRLFLDELHLNVDFTLISKDISLSSAAHYWTANIDKIFVQMILQRTDLALFTVGQTIGRLVDLTINQPIKMILTPLYANSGNVSRFNQFNAIEYRWTTLVTTLWATVLWCSPGSVLRLFPLTWHDDLLPIQIFSLVGIISPFINITGTAMLTTGSANIVRNYTGMRFISILIFSAPLLLVFHLLGAALLDLSVDCLVVAPFILYKAPKDLNAWALLKEVYPFLVVFFVCLFFTHFRFGIGIAFNPWMSLLVTCLLYLSLIYLWRSKVVKTDILTLVNSLRNTDKH